ncbi:MAG: aminotransferase class I/II-fold pyridoxal phosphate-dependent enzyme [Anaerolineae bacterium]|nr:aminotransferase class I/II-fold pyridoxal phosphate-dependent enzyme [Phycisphaerae bacterium]
MINADVLDAWFAPAPGVLKALAASLSRSCDTVGRVWIDETYIDYVGAAEHSLEQFATASRNVFICKSMSKVYALSGMRAAYLCGPASEIASLRTITPPWVIGLPAQVGAVEALRDPQYYAQRYRQTHALRKSLQRSLEGLNVDVVEGCANFLLTHLPPDAASAASIVERCRERGVFIRDASGMGRSMGDRAIRFAVKAGPEQRTMLEVFAQAMRVSAR